MTKEKALNEIMRVVEYDPRMHMSNTELVKAILGVFEKQTRIDQMEKDREMTMKNFKNFK